MLLLLDSLLRAILKHPFDGRCLRAVSLHLFGTLEGAPEVGKGLDLDQVPDLGEVGWDERAFADIGRGRDAGG